MSENIPVVRAKVWYGHATIREQTEISREKFGYFCKLLLTLYFQI